MSRDERQARITRYLMKNRPVECEVCKGKLFYEGGGRYKCHDCGEITLDDYGKVREFLVEYGPQPAVVVSEATGVSQEVLDLLLKDGKIEYTEDSVFLLKCEKCGCSLRTGRFCRECYNNLTAGLKSAFFGAVGDKVEPPKLNADLAGKMHFSRK